MLSKYFLAIPVLIVGLGHAARADQPTPADLAFFETRIRPIFVKHCYECHSESADPVRSGLRLDSRPASRAGGSRGPAVVPSKPDASWLLKAVSHADPKLKMPPRGKLPDQVIADLKLWIERGAADPRDEAADKPYVRATAADHWAYQPIKEPALPRPKDQAWAKKDLDRFIRTRLEDKGLSPSPDAEANTLLRRLHFDLVGLPPAPEALARFGQRVRKRGMDAALAAEVDELLASPRFGEKWGRHWLDVARFGESSGGEANISFPFAFRYRDYVIDAVNADLPYNRFLLEQIAGDLLPYQDDAERARLLIATGFLAVGPKNLDEGNALQFRADVIDEQIDAVTRAVLANSVACARCHDHKFDPFSMEDYYALAGIFKSTETFFGTAISPANRVGGDPLPLPRLDGQVIFQRSIAPEKVVALKKELAALDKEEAEGRAAVLKALAEGKDPSGLFDIGKALRIFWRKGAIEGELDTVDENGKALPLTMGVLDGKVGDAPLYRRGDVGRPADPVARRFPEALKLEGDFGIDSKQSGRLQLARWLTDARHPLTARVMVNRIWQHLLGAGLVATVDNFGSTGAKPSHPELLDFLAVRFVEEGWSVKKLIRHIVLSRTYRQASTFNRAAFLRDPDNRLLWRVSKRRLEAEAIRDSMLSVSGELDTKRPDGSLVARVIGPRPIALIGLDKRVPADLDGSVQRSLYLPVIRDRLPDALELFDFAEPSLVTGQRETTNVPLQALYLMNSPFVQQRAEGFAARLTRAGKTDAERIDLAFRLCFGRTPDADEKKQCLAFLTKEGSQLSSFCQALLCTAEFRNLD
ncbi:MAG: PSD1 and planctomycete cytochrome C domain-containing protein [Gemmataceae bacterium]